jgi:hypothetical protein
MKVVFVLDGKAVADVADATHIPREGDWIWLTLEGLKRDIYKVARVAWGTEVVEGTDPTRPLHTQTDAIILIETLPSVASAASTAVGS